jgi:hypothetical protein
MDPFAWGGLDGGKGGCGATQQVWDSEPFPFGSANHGKDEREGHSGPDV